MAHGLLEAVRGLWLADPELGPKPLLAKLREQQPDLGAGNKEVREALAALKAESKAREAAAAAPPAADEGGAPSSVAGWAAAALAASASAFSAISAARTSLVAALRSGCCSCSLASNGLKPRSGSATRSPRTASSRASGVLCLIVHNKHAIVFTHRC